MSGFVLIPEQLYNSTYNRDEPIKNEQEKYIELKEKVLNDSQFASQLIPLIPKPPPPSEPLIEANVVQDLQPQEIEQGQSDLHSRILSQIPIKKSSIKYKRIVALLQKFEKNPKLSLSNNDTILIEGVDTGVDLADFLYRVQTARSNFTNLERDIARILKIKTYEALQWITID